MDELTEDETEELLKIHGHQDKTKEFLVACPLGAFFCFVLFVRRILLRVGSPSHPFRRLQRAGSGLTCQRCAEVGQKALDAKKAEMEKRTFEEVQVFKYQCKIDSARW